MSRVFTRAGLAIAAVLSIVNARTASAQTGGDAERALSAVVAFRTSWIDRETPFDVCSVRLHTGGAPCAALPDLYARDRRLVTVDSVAPADSGARVTVTVRRGEQVHSETYSVRRSAPGLAWYVADVRLWGIERDFLPRTAQAERPE